MNYVNNITTSRDCERSVRILESWINEMMKKMLFVFSLCTVLFYQNVFKFHFKAFVRNNQG